MKTCRKCEAEKPLDDFYRRSDRTDGRDTICKDCDRARGKKYYANNKAKIAEKNKKWSEKNRDKMKMLQSDWYQKNKGKVSDQSRAWRRDNAERYQESRKKYSRTIRQKEALRAARIRSTPKGCIEDRVRRMVNHALQGKVKSGNTFDVLGYTPEDLVAHIERQFVDGMSWENRHLWHIDHKRPLASFQYSSSEDPDFKKAWCLDNLQPLWAADNLSKGARLPDAC